MEAVPLVTLPTCLDCPALITAGRRCASCARIAEAFPESPTPRIRLMKLAPDGRYAYVVTTKSLQAVWWWLGSRRGKRPHALHRRRLWIERADEPARYIGRPGVKTPWLRQSMEFEIVTLKSELAALKLFVMERLA